MSVKTRSYGLVLSFIILLVTGLFFFGAQGITLNRKDEVREITLVTKGMTFFEFGIRSSEFGVEANPSIFFKPGEKVRIIIRNEDPGILHDFVVEGLEIRLPQPLRFGESETLTFTAPEEGKIEYYCSEHPKMMRGEIVIQMNDSNHEISQDLH